MFFSTNFFSTKFCSIYRIKVFNYWILSIYHILCSSWTSLCNRFRRTVIIELRLRLDFKICSLFLSLTLLHVIILMKSFSWKKKLKFWVNRFYRLNWDKNLSETRLRLQFLTIRNSDVVSAHIKTHRNLALNLVITINLKRIDSVIIACNLVLVLKECERHSLERQ